MRIVSSNDLRLLGSGDIFVVYDPSGNSWSVLSDPPNTIQRNHSVNIIDNTLESDDLVKEYVKECAAAIKSPKK